MLVELQADDALGIGVGRLAGVNNVLGAVPKVILQTAGTVPLAAAARVVALRVVDAVHGALIRRRPGTSHNDRPRFISSHELVGRVGVGDLEIDGVDARHGSVHIVRHDHVVCYISLAVRVVCRDPRILIHSVALHGIALIHQRGHIEWIWALVGPGRWLHCGKPAAYHIALAHEVGRSLVIFRGKVNPVVARLVRQFVRGKQVVSIVRQVLPDGRFPNSEPSSRRKGIHGATCIVQSARLDNDRVDGVTFARGGGTLEQVIHKPGLVQPEVHICKFRAQGYKSGEAPWEGGLGEVGKVHRQMVGHVYQITIHILSNEVDIEGAVFGRRQILNTCADNGVRGWGVDGADSNGVVRRALQNLHRAGGQAARWKYAKVGHSRLV
mmetsp:Transcript_36015/g.64391  ORF Transcript_36015/g.64391 Transcript_36015/m.64391 type:complete len:382 (+) Transcript_36015:387-1532(+)